MSYKLIVEQEAELHLDAHIKAGNKILLRKIYKLFEELQEHPETGTGKPEKLRYKKMEIWSRRIDNKHRMEYIINNDKVKALNMAISEFKKHTNKFECLIHHSDRGVQYCSYSYVNQLK
ncbi:MAG: Txe/YoeB family addiction module toxin, partial [Paludibacter sp.]|nr:Txe/YoeB family addiction module toxin [Paludibacter sp.]